MDIKSEIEIKDELLESSEDVRSSGQNFEQNSWLEKIPKEIIYTLIDVKDEIEIKDEPLIFEEENLEREQHIEQTSPSEEEESLTHFSDVGHGEKDNRIEVKSPLRNEPQSPRRKNQNIKNNDLNNHGDESELHSKSQIKVEAKGALPQAKLIMRENYFSRSRNFDTKTSAIYSGPSSALLNKNIKNKKPFMCSYCKKSFSKCNLETHIRTHTGEKPFKCSYCDKSFSRKQHLENHIRIHTGEKPFKCSYCEKSFIAKFNLESHIRIHTGERLFKCSYCDKSFYRKQVLEVHIRIHTGEKPFKCSYCDKSFNCKKNLETHIRTHT